MHVPQELHHTCVLTGLVFIFFAGSVIKFPDKNNLMEKGFVLAHILEG